jgi:hypothetical protein
MRDLLSEAVVYVHPRLIRAESVGDRLRMLWAGVIAARELAAADVVEREFFQLAHDTGLATGLGHHADADLRHVIRWAMLGMNHGGAPRAWAEGLARLDPSRPPADVPPKRWARFIDDCGRFLSL